jgi:hypothetical protein
VRSSSQWFTHLVVVCVTSSLVLGACVAGSAPLPDSGPTTTRVQVTTTTTIAGSTTTSSQQTAAGEAGLYRVDPATLEPISDTAPLTTGDWLSGTASPNGQWLVLNVWIDTEPDTDMIRVIDVAAGRVVTEATGALRHDLRVNDNGAVFALSGDTAPILRLERLPKGASGFQTVFDGFPDRFTPWSGSTTLLDDNRLASFGLIGDYLENPTPVIVIGDLSTGESLAIPLPDVALGVVSEQDLGDWVAPEIIEPAVVWDTERNRALVVHADRPAVTAVDLDTGEHNDHTWGAEASWLGSLFAWLMPPAQAKGPSFGSSRTAVLSPSGNFLYVGSANAEIIVGEDKNWSVRTTPQGVEAINTETWEVVASWDIPASQVSLSPDAAYLVATGLGITDKLSTTDYHPEGAFIIRANTLNLIGHVNTRGYWHPDIQYSADSTYLYAGNFGGGPIDVIELETARVMKTVRGGEQLTVFGEAALLSTTQR